MTTKIHAVNGAGSHEREAVAVDRLVEGAPVTETALDYERDGTFAGEWSAGVGVWRVRYDEWEFCHILEGVCELVSDADGSARRFSPGDSFIVEPGFAGVWRVLQPMKKRFVIRSA